MKRLRCISLSYIEHDTDIIPVSFYSLTGQLSFDIQHLIFIHCRNSRKVEIWLRNTLLTSRGQKGQI